LGYGEMTLNLVINRLRETIKAKQTIASELDKAQDKDIATLLPPPSAPRTTPRISDSPILGVEGLLYHLAGCCNPVPGEAIIGVVTLSSRGISIHRQGCSNTDSIPGDRLIPVSWNNSEACSGRSQTYPVQIHIEVIDRVGVLKDILSRLSDFNINVRSAQVKTVPGQTAMIHLGIDIQDHQQLDRTFSQIRKMSDVISIHRVSQAEDCSV
ncbi:MAG: bifunctional (p)ppGpp synthetase/guanosine-3',5'-bis(diphosphate) 3'-pyrophosphohydrolase, partial [Microcoleus sp. SIO2G3]|nr:bifunctional (p)ppGpp synthetase/guanosine-3',5'-bis(diphosphate) 3'-pyrophosphohydrolase [Microcoleus sp. SIO2G3]